MTDPTPPLPKPIPVDPNLGELSYPRIGRAWLGSGMATGLALLLYRMVNSIALTFAQKPVTSDNVTVVNLSAAVRTLVIGIVALGTGVFAIAALGLALLAVKMTWQRWVGSQPPSTDS